MYKSFISAELEYGDIIYDWACNKLFHKKIESIQCNADIAMNGTVRGASCEKPNQELSLESLKLKEWSRKLFARTFDE